MIKVTTSIPKILGKLYGFPKKSEKSSASLRKKNSKFSGNFPSEQISKSKYSVGCHTKEVFEYKRWSY